MNRISLFLFTINLYFKPENFISIIHQKKHKFVKKNYKKFSYKEYFEKKKRKRKTEIYQKKEKLF